MRFHILLLLLLIVLPITTRAAPVAVEGLIDLTDWNFESDGNIALDGEYEFYWERYLSRRELLTEQPTHFATVPGPWNGHETGAGPAPAEGYATYRLNILIGPDTGPLALKIKDFGTAGKLYINGELALQMGHPGTGPRTTMGYYKPAVVDFTTGSQRIELVFHIANYNHRRGGIWESVFLGNSRQIHQRAEQVAAYDLLMSGALLMIALFNLALFLLRRDYFASLFLALFCIFAPLRILSINDRLLLGLFPEMSWTLLTRIEYISWFVLITFFAHFLRNLYPREVDRRAIWLIDAVVVLAVLTVIATPLRIFSWTAPVMQIFHLVVLGYGFYVLLMARRHRREGSNLLLFGYLFLAICSVNDVLVAAWLFDSPNLVALGVVGFAVCQTMLASYAYALSMRTVEQQYEQLATSSLKLQTQEKLRLEAELASRKVAARFKESQQFEALGLLAHGIVSDLKESFSSAAAEAEALTEALKSDPRLLAALEATRQAADRSVAVIEDLLSLSAFDTENERTEVNQVIHQVLDNPRIQENADNKGVDIKTSLNESIQPVRGSRLYLQRILENLIANSFDSQPTGGHTILGTEQIYTDGRTLFYDTIGPGYYVILSIEDIGSGIHPEDLDSIFQPFFSRKSTASESQGLGMSVVRTIVKQLDGGIDVISEMGKGTRFDIYLPVAPP